MEPGRVGVHLEDGVVLDEEHGVRVVVVRTGAHRDRVVRTGVTVAGVVARRGDVAATRHVSVEPDPIRSVRPGLFCGHGARAVGEVAVEIDGSPQQRRGGTFGGRGGCQRGRRGEQGGEDGHHGAGDGGDLPPFQAHHSIRGPTQHASAGAGSGGAAHAATASTSARAAARVRFRVSLRAVSFRLGSRRGFPSRRFQGPARSPAGGRRIRRTGGHPNGRGASPEGGHTRRRSLGVSRGRGRMSPMSGGDHRRREIAAIR